MGNKFLLYFKHKDMNYVINGKENPEEAIDCFIRTNMDVLVLENWIISR